MRKQHGLQRIHICQYHGCNRLCGGLLPQDRTGLPRHHQFQAAQFRLPILLWCVMKSVTCGVAQHSALGCLGPDTASSHPASNSSPTLSGLSAFNINILDERTCYACHRPRSRHILLFLLQIPQARSDASDRCNGSSHRIALTGLKY
jgi:hypothetical protein